LVQPEQSPAPELPAEWLHMDDPAIALVLEECLALLRAGEEIDAIVERFPDFSETLDPILRLAQELQETADDAVDVPIDALEDLGEFIRAQFGELTD
jgi:hypothetical protein